MTRRVQTLLGGVVILALLLPLALSMKIQFVALVPGPTINTIGDYQNKPVILVEGKAPNKRSGHLNLTTIGVVSDISLLQAVEGWFDDAVSVVPTETVYPPNVSKDQVDKQNKQDYDNSENSAVAAALDYLGYPSKVVIRQPPEGSNLKAGDAIAAVDGTSIESYEDLQTLLKKTPPKTSLTIEYLRFGKSATTTVTTAGADGVEGSRIGVVVTQRPYAPFNVSFAKNDIGGPSAGLMLTLGIIDLVGPKTITDGKFIAGTGTINAQGEVGPIGGIRLKMKAAREAGALVFLVPADNCAEALINPPDGLKIIKADKVTDAVSSVASFVAGKSTPACTG